MNRNQILSLLSLLVAQGIFAQEIAVEALDNNRFRLSFSSDSVTGVDFAQAHLLPTASRLCSGVAPVFGRYSFSQSELLGHDGVVGGESFTFEQEISCTAATVQGSTDFPQTLSRQEALEAESLIRALSTEYLENIGNERYEEAYAVIAESLREFSTAESWKDDKQSFRAEVGAPVSIAIVLLTVYVNPPNAPRLGIYIAADFNNQYEFAPVHCGHLMWFRGEDGQFRIVAEVTGHVTAETLATIPSEQMPIIRQRLRCIAPPSVGTGADGVASQGPPFDPFPEARVTLDQWTSYHSEVRAAFGESAQELVTEQMTTYFDEANFTQYVFTLPGNPAHPAWIARRVVTRGQETSIGLVGYFAGSEQSFAEWFSAFQRQNEQMTPLR
jgi:hypothetical protein